MEVTLDIPIMMMVFLFVVSVVAAFIAAKCIQQATVRASYSYGSIESAMGGYVVGGIISLLFTLIFGGHFIYILNHIVCKLGGMI